MEKKLIVCVNRRPGPLQPSCAAHNAEALASRLEALLLERNIPLQLERVNCLGECNNGPVMRLAPAGPFIRNWGEEAIEVLLERFERFARNE